MPTIETNGVTLAYEVSGQGEPMLMIMGLGGQLTDWHPQLIERLSSHFMVIRFDNRDIGLSTQFGTESPTRWQMIKSSVSFWTDDAPYELTDMADDTAGLLDALDISQAHVVGMSMGGMIAQQLTIRHPCKVSTLCSIMSNTGSRRSGQPTPRVLAALARRGEPSRAEAIDVTMRLFSMIGGADWDPEEQRRRSGLSVARSYNPAGVLRQSQAVAAAIDRTERLKLIAQPTLVMHGLDDTLVRPSGGIATAQAIPDSRLIMFPRMGHDLPATRHDEMVDAIRTNAARRPLKTAGTVAHIA